MLREPLLKVMHVLRSLEFAPKDGREIELHGLMGGISQQAHEQPSVFNFFGADYQPPGPVGSGGLFSPEAEIATTPQMIDFMNGMQSLAYLGLTSCLGGFGGGSVDRSCHSCNGQAHATADGVLTWTPRDANRSATVITELDLLLTGGRLNARSREIIQAQHAAMLTTPDYCERNYPRGATPAKNALSLAETLFMATQEFHSSNTASIQPSSRLPAPTVVSQNRTYRATVVVYLQGGCDSFNLLVPHSGCTANDNKDMYLFRLISLHTCTIVQTELTRIYHTIRLYNTH